MYRVRLLVGRHSEGGKYYSKNDVFLTKYCLWESMPDRFQLVEDMTVVKEKDINQDVETNTFDPISTVEEPEQTRETINGFDERFTLVQKVGESKYRIYDELKGINVGKNKKYQKSEVDSAIKQYLKGL